MYFAEMQKCLKFVMLSVVEASLGRHLLGQDKPKSRGYKHYS